MSVAVPEVRGLRGRRLGQREGEDSVNNHDWLLSGPAKAGPYR